MGNGFEIGVEDAALVDRFPVAVCVGSRVEAASQLVLGFGGKVVLSFDEDDIVGVESGAQEAECIVCGESMTVVSIWTTNRPYNHGALPVRFSTSTPNTSAPKSTSEVDDFVSGCTENVGWLPMVFEGIQLARLEIEVFLC